MEYLSQNNFWDILSEGLLEDFDRFVQHQIVKRGKKSDLCALGYYLLYRLNNLTSEHDEYNRLFNQESMMHFINILENEGKPAADELTCVLLLLHKVHQLNICNPKIDRYMQCISPEYSFKDIENG